MTSFITARSTRTFIIIWFGQLISLVGSELTSFALGIWVLEQTGSITEFAFIALSATLPSTLIAPLAGVLVDRWNRRNVMILSDSAAGLSTLVIFLLLVNGNLEVWHIYVSAGISSTAKAFQIPAYTAAITLLVPRENLGRANGMIQGAQAAAQLFAPAIAGILVVTVQVEGVILVDFSTFLFALTTLLFISIPTVTPSDQTKTGQSVWQEISEGWGFIVNRAGLLGVFTLFAISNFVTSMAVVLITPLILSFASAAVLGSILSIGGSGMLVGSVVMGVWGGPKRLIYGILGFGFLSGVSFVGISLRPSAILITCCAFVIFFDVAMVNSCNQSIWQRKVPTQLQGRVFALLHMVSSSLIPLAFLLTGPLADNVFEPLLAENGALAPSVGQLIGVGPGRGIAFMFALIGLVNILVVMVGVLYSRVRRVELELPDTVVEKV